MLALILSLPTENATVRMRLWRTLKSSGAAVLRDGVYLMPERESCRTILETVAADVQASGGTAYVLNVDEPVGADFIALFDRSNEYAALLTDLANIQHALSAQNAADVLKQVRKLRKSYLNLVEIDFFPGEAQRQADTALRDVELSIARLMSPDEPHAVDRSIPTLSIKDFQNRTWATRQRPWVDRLASAWLIQRFIDANARFLWLETADQCPNDAIGYDFDGATFSHVGSRVTFEVLLTSFNLEQPALKRIGAIVHFLDVGGIQPSETVGVESVLMGLRELIRDDNQLLMSANSIFDGLFTAFSKG